MVALRRAADGLIALAALVGTLGLLFLAVLIVCDVIARSLGAPITGAQDLTTMSMVLVVFGGMALCDRLGGHVAVDVLEPWLPAGLRRVTDVLIAVLGAVSFALIAWTVWESAVLSQLLHLRTNIIALPKAWFQWAVCGFAAITALGMALRAVELALGRPAPDPGEGARMLE
jgi:TRAP-type C4-dicarboxylate transport system permease small subunit